MAGAETIEHMEKWDAGAKGGGVGDGGQVLGLLHRCAEEHAPAAAAHGHDIAVVAVDRHRMGGDAAGGDVDDRGRQFPGDAKQVGQHQQQALGGRETGAQAAAQQRAMEGPGGTALALQLDDFGHLSPQVGPPGGRPGLA